MLRSASASAIIPSQRPATAMPADVGPPEGSRSASSRMFFRAAGGSSYTVATGTPPTAPRRWASA